MSWYQYLLVMVDEIINRYPSKTRWDMKSAIMYDPGPFYGIMSYWIDLHAAKTGKLIWPCCTGSTGALLLGNWNDGGFYYAATPEAGEYSWSYPTWFDSRSDGQRYALIFTAFDDEIPALRAAAQAEGINVLDEISFKKLTDREN